MSDDELVLRWPHQKSLSPTSLKTYSQCAYRIRLQYVDEIPRPDIFVPFFAIGNATHSALGTIAQQMKLGVPTIGEKEIRMLCSFHMPMHHYPSEEAWEAEVQKVLRWVDTGKRYLQRLQVEEWLLIEHWEAREIPLLPTKARYKLGAKPDLVVRRRDEEGEPLIHIIDYKTGQVREEPDVPVIQRFALRPLLQEWTGDASAANVRFTWIWLDENYPRDVDVSVEHCNHAWPEIMAQMESLVSEAIFAPTPGWYCRYCPYYQNYCTEEIPPQLD
ncbi:MAG: PD-(D/E)XK nuclease family protein [Thermomicrobiales bacterium]|nr:PD-(D/E)XK nuclease family protein [Thermomicrobiales bacterium]